MTINNKNITHQVVYNTKDKYITFKSLGTTMSFTLVRDENGLSFNIPVFNPGYEIFEQTNAWYVSIIEYIINNNIAKYISFKIETVITSCHFQLNPYDVLSLI